MKISDFDIGYKPWDFNAIDECKLVKNDLPVRVNILRDPSAILTSIRIALRFYT